MLFLLLVSYLPVFIGFNLVWYCQLPPLKWCFVSKGRKEKANPLIAGISARWKPILNCLPSSKKKTVNSFRTALIIVSAFFCFFIFHFIYSDIMSLGTLALIFIHILMKIWADILSTRTFLLLIAILDYQEKLTHSTILRIGLYNYAPRYIFSTLLTVFTSRMVFDFEREMIFDNFQALLIVLCIKYISSQWILYPLLFPEKAWIKAPDDNQF